MFFKGARHQFAVRPCGSRWHNRVIRGIVLNCQLLEGMLMSALCSLQECNKDFFSILLFQFTNGLLTPFLRVVNVHYLDKAICIPYLYTLVKQL